VFLNRRVYVIKTFLNAKRTPLGRPRREMAVTLIPALLNFLAAPGMPCSANVVNPSCSCLLRTKPLAKLSPWTRITKNCVWSCGQDFYPLPSTLATFNQRPAKFRVKMENLVFSLHSNSFRGIINQVFSRFICKLSCLKQVSPFSFEQSWE